MSSCRATNGKPIADGARYECLMCKVHEASYLRNGEARELLVRLVKYARDDRAETPGVTWLSRLIEQVDDYLKRTNNPLVADKLGET